MYRGTPMFGNVTALLGWICIGEILERKACRTHAPGMRPGFLTLDSREQTAGRVFYCQPTGPNTLYHRDDYVERPRAMGV